MKLSYEDNNTNNLDTNKSSLNPASALNNGGGPIPDFRLIDDDEDNDKLDLCGSDSDSDDNDDDTEADKPTPLKTDNISKISN